MTTIIVEFGPCRIQQKVTVDHPKALEIMEQCIKQHAALLAGVEMTVIAELAMTNETELEPYKYLTHKIQQLACDMIEEIELAERTGLIE